MQLIECVPNFSEGRNVHIIESIAAAIQSVDGAQLLHTDIGASVNRTVMTIAGAPELVIEAAFRAIEQASKLIDMQEHEGHHPCIGATDVCPIIPLKDISMEECVQLSKKLAQRVWQDLKIPVYLYGESAQTPQRRQLSYLRRGGYAGLAGRVNDISFYPDFGDYNYYQKSGATIIGARPLLIAYNINLNTQNLQIAKAIASTIREERDSNIGGWQQTTAIGWYVEDYQCCQISMNLMNYEKVGLYQAFTGVSNLAGKHDVKVTGSEIIGMLPLQALIDTGKFIYQNKGRASAANQSELTHMAIKFLNLDQFHPFKVEEKVLEYKLARLY